MVRDWGTPDAYFHSRVPGRYFRGGDVNTFMAFRCGPIRDRRRMEKCLPCLRTEAAVGRTYRKDCSSYSEFRWDLERVGSARAPERALFTRALLFSRDERHITWSGGIFNCFCAHSSQDSRAILSVLIALLLNDSNVVH